MADTQDVPDRSMVESKRARQIAQMSFNVAHYERIFVECLGAAERIVGDRIAVGKGGDPADKLKIASDIFNQYCDDQSSVNVEKIRAQVQHQLMDPLLNLAERRGAHI